MPRGMMRAFAMALVPSGACGAAAVRTYPSPSQAAQTHTQDVRVANGTPLASPG